MVSFFQCRCGIRYLVRRPRATWMKVFFGRALYGCASCNRRQLLPRKTIDAAIREYLHG